MERVWQKILIGAALLFVRGTEAGTVLLPPPAAPRPISEARESYPESSFGKPPARETTSRFAAIEDEGAPELALDPIGRGPASEPPPVEAVRAGIHRVPELPPELSASVARRKGVQEVALIAGDLGFFPKTVFVTRDIPVRLFVTGSSKNTLCIMMDSFQVRKQVRAQRIEEINFTPSSPGRYRFYCPVNGMEGTLIVKELASALPSDRAPASE
jgi:plastocyanin